MVDFQTCGFDALKEPEEPEEQTRELYVDVGGSLGAVRLLAPASRLTRWPAGDLWPAGRAFAARLSADPDLVRGRHPCSAG